jgi:PAS domain S-box-containing protein
MNPTDLVGGLFGADLLDSISESLGAGLAIISRDYRTLWANRTLVNIFGEVVGKPCYAAYNQRDSICPACGVREVFELGVERAVHEQLGTNHAGEEVWSQIIATPLRDPQGQVVAALELVVPITERKRAELLLKDHSSKLESMVAARTAELQRASDRLRESEELYRSLVDNIDLGIMLIDSEHNILAANPAQGRLFGRSPNGLVGTKCHLALERSGAPCQPCAGLEALASGKPVVRERRTVRNGGEEIDLRMHAFPLRDADGKCERFVAVMEDISEERRLREQVLHSERLAAVGQLAAGVAHEFNNLLAVVDSHAQGLLLDHEEGLSPLSPEVLQGLTGISETAQRGGAIVRDMMAFARPSPPERKRRSLRKLLVQTLELQEKPLSLQHIELVRDLRTDAFCRIDARQLQQVFLNLLINARHALQPKGGGRISVGLEEAGGEAIVRIADTGVGMRDEVRRKLFSPFFTTKSAYAEDTLGIQGTGLGLSVSYQLVRQHGGTITCESVEGRGTEFTLTLPLAAEGEEATAVTPAPGESAPAGSTSVLVVDDEPAITQTLESILSARGYQVSVADRGKVALELFAAKPHDIVLLDLLMPDMRGRDVLARLRELSTETRIVVITGQLEVDEHELLAAGAQAVVRKPYEVRALLAVLTRLASRSP